MLGEFQLDHVAISKHNIKEIMNVKVTRNREFDSDHYLTKIKMKLFPNTSQKRQQRVMKYNTDRLTTMKDAIKHFQEEIKISESGKWEE